MAARGDRRRGRAGQPDVARRMGENLGVYAPARNRAARRGATTMPPVG